MPDDLLTPDAVSHAPEAAETEAADAADPHDVAPPEPQEQPAAETAAHDETPPAPVEEAPAPPAEAVVAEEPPPEAAAPPEPTATVAEEEDEDESADDEEAEAALAAMPDEPVPEPSNKHWYVVKVQSGREDTIKEAIERRVKIERLEEYFGQIVIPVERVTEMRNGKRVVKERKLYPGYLMTEVEYNDRILYLFRETSGVGDFVGGTLNRPPPPMAPREVERMLGGGKKGEAKTEKVVEAKAPVDRGDRVKVRDGTFAGMEGEVKEILEKLNKLKVELTIFGRPVSVELEYWQVEPV